MDVRAQAGKDNKEAEMNIDCGKTEAALQDLEQNDEATHGLRKDQSSSSKGETRLPPVEHTLVNRERETQRDNGITEDSAETSRVNTSVNPVSALVTRQATSQGEQHLARENKENHHNAMGSKGSIPMIRYTIRDINIELPGDEQSLAELAEIDKLTSLGEKRLLRYFQRLNKAKMERLNALGELTKQASLREEMEVKRLQVRIAEERQALNEANDVEVSDLNRKEKRQVTFAEGDAAQRSSHQVQAQQESQNTEVPYSPDTIQSPLYGNQREDNSHLIIRPGNVTPLYAPSIPPPRMRNASNTATLAPLQR